MVVAIKKCDIMACLVAEPSEVRWSQVACLYWRFHKTEQEIADITGYALKTVKSYVNKYHALEKYYDKYFNFDAPEQTKQVRKPLPTFNDKYPEKEIPKECGLYLIGSVYTDPHTKEVYYWIKVGMSTNLYNRIKQYRSHNPMVWVSDLLLVDIDFVYKMESECHIALSDVAFGLAKDTEEWFIVDRDTYLEICESGFHYFYNYED